MAEALIRYDGEPSAPEMFYAVDVGGRRLRTSVLTRPDWLVPGPLDGAGERAELLREPTPPISLDPTGAAAAVRRLAAVEVTGTVLTRRFVVS